MNSHSLLQTKPLVDSFLKGGPRPLSCFSFVSIFAWCDFFEFEIKMVNKCLCIFAHSHGERFLYLPPLGNSFDSATIDLIFGYMAQGGKSKPVHRIENIPGNSLSAFGQGRYNQHIRPVEYVYRKEDLKALKGNAYKSQRHDCNLFVSHHGAHSFGPYKDTDYDACLELFDRWAEGRSKINSDPVYLSMLQENRQVHARLLKFWQPLGLVIRVLKTEDRLIGYTFGYVLDEDTFCIYAEIADLKVTGAAAYMFKSFCSDEELNKITRINTMDDFAMPNVAKAKQAYHPAGLIPSYSVTRKNEEYT